MEAILFLPLLFAFVSPNCLPEADRIDCLKDDVSADQEQNIYKCSQKGCNWCPTTVANSPWCHHNLTAVCGQPLIDCGYIGITQEGCENRGCVYNPNKRGDPWCCNKFNTGGGVCASNTHHNHRIDCFPLAEGPSREGCLARGCQWCPTEAAPWCFYEKNKFVDPPRDEERIDCNPKGGAISSIDCVTRGCQYRPSQIQNAPWCFFPKNRGYRMINGSSHLTEKGYYIELDYQSSITFYKDRIDRVGLDIEFQTDDRVRVKFYDRTKPRFEVPLDIPSPDRRAANPQYEVSWSNDPVFALKVIRKSTGTVVFDTSIGGLHLENQFLQIATKLPSTDVYGFGENLHYDFRRNVNLWKADGMFTRDQPPMDGANLYGVHPVYHVLEGDGNAHGVLFLNSAAQDATLTPGPGLIYRTIGGVLDIYIFMGPTPDNVIQEYTEAVGRPVMPPYWALGFSLAKFGYDHIDRMKENIDRMRNYQIPQDYQFLDIDYMDRNIDFTYSTTKYAGLPQYMREQQQRGLRFIAILDPAIPNSLPNYRPFDEGQKQNAWVTYPDGTTPVPGKVWPPGEVYYPDFTRPSTQNWWVQMCREFHQSVPYDGLWIDMNEPANFYWGTTQGCPFNNINYPPYMPKIWGPNLFYKTLCPEHRHNIGLHYDVHSLYGWSQAPPTLEAARQSTKKRSLVLSRSTFPGAGKYAVHWLGDNWSRWDSMKASLSGMFEFNMFGMPFVGADICGFIGDSTYELCMRWQQVGSFYPFSRNHNLRYENRDQDPTVWGEEFARVSRATLNIRYTLLPHLYTLLHKAHINGTSVIRPLLNVFPEDKETRIIDRQFLWGSSFMVSPVLDEGARNVRAYFPDARWFSYYDGKELVARKKYVTLGADLDFIPLHVRGGSILPTQEPAINTKQSRVNPMGLIVALDDLGSANGTLFWDDGESIETHRTGQYTYIDFKAIKNELSSVIVHDGFWGSRDLVMDTVRILGIRDVVSIVTVGESDRKIPFTFTKETMELKVTNLKIGLTIPLLLRWS